MQNIRFPIAASGDGIEISITPMFGKDGVIKSYTAKMVFYGSAGAKHGDGIPASSYENVAIEEYFAEDQLYLLMNAITDSMVALQAISDLK